MKSKRKTAPKGGFSNTSCKNAVGLVLSIASKQITATLTNQPELYLKRINSCNLIGNAYALVSPKHCELSLRFVADLQIKTNQPKNALRLALRIFKSGSNRIKLTVVRSGAATPKKMFLMLAGLSEIIKSNDGLGQLQLLIDNCTQNKVGLCV